MYQILLSRTEVFYKSHDALKTINPCFRKMKGTKTEHDIISFSNIKSIL